MGCDVGTGHGELFTTLGLRPPHSLCVSSSPLPRRLGAAPGPPRGMGVALRLGLDCWPRNSQNFWCHHIFSWEIFLQFLMALPSLVILGWTHRALAFVHILGSYPCLSCPAAPFTSHGLHAHARWVLPPVARLSCERKWDFVTFLMFCCSG